jgi:cell division protein FtsN
MSIINSSTTGHSAKQERKFANKLFLGLGIAVVVAFVIFLVVRQGKSLKPQPIQEQVPPPTSDMAPAIQGPKK